MNEERILDMKKIAIVTGGNKGIGLEVTKSLLTKNCKVYSLTITTHKQIRIDL